MALLLGRDMAALPGWLPRTQTEPKGQLSAGERSCCSFTLSLTLPKAWARTSPGASETRLKALAPVASLELLLLGFPQRTPYVAGP